MAEIIINDITPRDQYTAAGAEPSFIYNFPIFAVGDITVLEQTDLAAVPVTLIEGTDYTVTGVGAVAGGTIVLDVGVYPSGATAGVIYTIFRNVAEERITDFTTGGDFLAATMNRELDLITMNIQELQLDLERKLGLKIEDVATALTLKSEAAATRANKLLSFDDTGLEVKSTAPLSAAGPSIVAVTATRALADATDDGSELRVSSASPVVLTAPLNLDNNFRASVFRDGAGTASITVTTPDTLNGVTAGTATIDAQYSGAFLRQTADGTFFITGNVTVT